MLCDVFLYYVEVCINSFFNERLMGFQEIYYFVTKYLRWWKYVTIFLDTIIGKYLLLPIYNFKILRYESFFFLFYHGYQILSIRQEFSHKTLIIKKNQYYNNKIDDLLLWTKYFWQIIALERLRKVKYK